MVLVMKMKRGRVPNACTELSKAFCLRPERGLSYSFLGSGGLDFANCTANPAMQQYDNASLFFFLLDHSGALFPTVSLPRIMTLYSMSLNVWSAVPNEESVTFARHCTHLIFQGG